MPGLRAEPIKPDPTVRDPYTREADPGAIQPNASLQLRVADALSAHFSTGIDEAKRHREQIGIDARLVADLRAYRGEYDPETLQLIAEQGGTTVYRRITTGKCNDLSAWLKDIIADIKQRAWDLDPTPIANLPDSIQQQIEGEMQDDMVQQQFQLIASVESGEIPFEQYEALRDELTDPIARQDMLEEMEDQALKEMQAEAKERVQRMIRVCQDQQNDGAWTDALADFIEDYKIYPAAFVRGPFVKLEKQLDFSGPGAHPTVISKPILAWSRISPFNVFPSPNSTTPQNGGFHHREYMNKKDVYSLIGLPGYKESAVRQVLAKRGHLVTTHSVETTSDVERNDLQGKPRPFEETSDSPFEAFHSYDAVEGKHLNEWGMNVKDPERPYEVYALSIDGIVVKASLNADPLGRRPVSMDSFRTVPDSFWGESLPESMADIQDECNAAVRTMVNNLAMSSGPMGAVDLNALAEGFDLANISPWMLYQYDGSKLQAGARKPIEYHDIPCHVDLYMKVYNEIKKEADDVTGIPAFVHGSGQTEGAGETARGLAMLMDSAAKGIRENIRRIGRKIITDSLERQYVWNMLYHPNPRIKGDAQIRSKGPLAVIAQQQAQQEVGRFLAATNNDLDASIIGKGRRANLIREQAGTLNLDPDDVGPTEDQIERLRKIDDEILEASMQQPAEVVPVEGEPQPEVVQ